MEEHYLSPSGLRYALECPRCLVVADRFGIESDGNMPWMSAFAAWQEKHFVGRTLSDEVPGAPDWRVESKGSKSFRSAPLPLTGVSRSYVLKGRYDLLAVDRDGRTYIVDCKTSKPSDDKADQYRLQLSAYARMFEQPHPDDERAPIKIEGLGLLIHHPQGFDRLESTQSNAQHHFPIHSSFVAVDRDDQAVLDRARDIATVLEARDLPPLSDECSECQREAFGHRQGSV